MSRARITLVLLWLVALFLTGWVLMQLPLAAIHESVKALSVWQWLAWIVANILVITLLTWRWQLLSNLLEHPPGFITLLSVRQAGQAISFLTPGPQFGGEPLQVFWLWKKSGLKIHAATLGLGLDRFFELWVNFSVLILAMGFLLASTVTQIQNWQEILLSLVLLLIVLTSSGWLILQRPAWITRLLGKLIWPWRHHPRLQKVDSHWQALTADLARIVRDKKTALSKAFFLSLCGWGAMLVELWLLLVMLDLSVDFSMFMLILVATRLAFLLPLPGGVGTLEAAVLWAFQVLDLPLSAAMGLIALMRLRDGIILVIGLGLLKRLNSNQ